ncbi:hypothetical protein K439DRAFT_1642149 [Ramaria rubella]|nr:hypothetical protein K439DRAFT_1642149 [Ramaria rubella]
MCDASGLGTHSHLHSTRSGSTTSKKESADSPRSLPSGLHLPATGVAIPPPPARTPTCDASEQALPRCCPPCLRHTPAPRVLSHIFVTPAMRIPAHISHILAQTWTRTRTRTISVSGYGGGEPAVYESEEGGEVVIDADEERCVSSPEGVGLLVSPPVHPFRTHENMYIENLFEPENQTARIPLSRHSFIPLFANSQHHSPVHAD